MRSIQPSLDRVLRAALSLLMVVQPALFATPAAAMATANSSSVARQGGAETPIAGAVAISPQSGDAMFTISIELPPGTNGHVPSVALTYSSGNRQSSWVGRGWNIRTSSIKRSLRNGTPNYIDRESDRRCLADISHVCGDPIGAQGPVPCGAVDDVCLLPDTFELDGEPLVYLFTDANGDEFYETKRQSPLQIVRTMTVADPSGWWEVTQPDGTVLNYGGLAAFSRVDHPESGLPGSRFENKTYEWLLFSEEDTAGIDESTPGNTIIHAYAVIAGIAYPSAIQYGQNPQRVVSFLRETSDRPDQTVSHIAGFEQKLTQRLREIEVREGIGSALADLIRSYELVYQLSPHSGRSLLQEVREYGVGREPAISPRTTSFTYTDNGTKGWAASPVSHLGPFLFGGFGDINGDGLTDLYQGWDTNGANVGNLFLSTGSAFEVTGSAHNYPKPTFGGGDLVHFLDANAFVESPVLIDVNRDGRSDVLQRELRLGLQFQWRNQTNWPRSGPGSWDNSLAPIADGHFFTGLYSGSTLGSAVGAQYPDLNGDGAPEIALRNDVLFFGSAPGTCVERRISDFYYWNRGDGAWTKAKTTPGSVPGCTASDTETSTEFRAIAAHIGGVVEHGTVPPVTDQSHHHAFIDLNGDGLSDFLVGDTGAALLNNGNRDFAADTGWNSPVAPSTPAWADEGVRFADINGDGHVDVLRAKAGSARQRWLGDGDTEEPGTSTAWNEVITQDWLVPVDFADSSGNPTGHQLFDFDGDGLPEIVEFQTNQALVWQNLASHPDFLETVTHPLGGVSTVRYEAAAVATVVDPTVTAFPNTVVDANNNDVGQDPSGGQLAVSVETNDQNGVISLTRLEYARGLFDPVARESRGFETVTQTQGPGDGAGAFLAELVSTETVFHQSEALIGLVDFQKVFDPAVAAPLRETYFEYGGNPADERLPICIANKETEILGGSRTTGRKFIYDANGNPTEIHELGLIVDNTAGPGALCADDLSDSARITKLTYAVGSAGVLNRPSRRELWANQIGAPGIKLRENEFYYDGPSGQPLPLGQVSEGKLTKLVQIDDSIVPQGRETITFFYDAATSQLTKTVNARRNGGEFTTEAEGANEFDYAASDFVVQSLGRQVLHSDSLLDFRPTTTRSYVAPASCAVKAPISAGRVATKTDVNGRTTTRCYDEFGRTTQISIHDGESIEGARTTISYDDAVASVTIKRSTNIVAAPTDFNDEIRILDGFGRVVLTDSSGPGSIPTRIQRSVVYDALGRVVRQSLPGTGAPGADTVFALDALGREKLRTLPGSGRVWTTSYSIAAGERVTEIQDPVSRVTQRIANAFGDIVSVVEVVDPGGPSPVNTTTIYQYDAAGQLGLIKDHNGNETKFFYNDRGRRIQLVDPDTGIWNFAYDAGGNLKTQDGPANLAVAWTYDALDRPTNQDANGTNDDVTWAYDQLASGPSKGLLTFEVGSMYTRQLRYEGIGDLGAETWEVGSHQFDFGMAYNDLGQLTERTYPSGRVLTWERDSGGFVTAVKTDAGASQYASGVTWNALGELESWTSGGGITTSAGTDPTTRLPSQLQITGGAFPSITLAYAHFGDDRLATVNTNEFVFQYDDLGRLSQAEGPYDTGYSPRTLYYDYDNIGNLTCLDATLAPTPTACPGGSRFEYLGTTPHAASQVTIGGSTTPLAYSADGNLESHSAHGSWSLTYDELGRVRTVDGGPGKLKTVDYRADGIAVRLNAGVGGTDVHRPGDDFEWDASTNIATLHVSLGGQVIALHDETFVPPTGPGCGSVLPGLPIGRTPPGAELAALLAYALLGLALIRALELARRRRRPIRSLVAVSTAGIFWFAYSVPAIVLVPTAAEAAVLPAKYLHADRLGSSVYVSDETGSTPTRVVYRPFGAEVEPSPGTSTAPRLAFTGQRLESEIELYDYGARWYDPALGRFLQPDALAPVFVPQGLNPYGYVRNDPVNLVDPTGNTFEDIIGTIQIGFSIGSVFSAGGVAVGNCGFFGLTGVNPFVSSCPAAPSIPQILSQVLDSIIPGAGGLVDVFSGSALALDDPKEDPPSIGDGAIGTLFDMSIILVGARQARDRIAAAEQAAGRELSIEEKLQVVSDFETQLQQAIDESKREIAILERRVEVSKQLNRGEFFRELRSFPDRLKIAREMAGLENAVNANRLRLRGVRGVKNQVATGGR